MLRILRSQIWSYLQIERQDCDSVKGKLESRQKEGLSLKDFKDGDKKLNSENNLKTKLIKLGNHQHRDQKHT